MYTQDTPFTISRPATEKQLTYIRSMVNDKYTEDERTPYIEFLDTAAISSVRASEIITHLKSLPDLHADVEVGMYRVDGVVYKVQMSQGYYGVAGRLYAKRLTDDGFVMAPGAIRKIRVSHRMTLEEAKEYGRIYNVCCVCGRVLTDEKSMAEGIGPRCSGKV